MSTALVVIGRRVVDNRGAVWGRCRVRRVRLCALLELIWCICGVFAWFVLVAMYYIGVAL